MGSSRNWLSSSNKNWLGKNILWKHHIQIYLKHGIWALCIFKKTLKKNIFPPVIKHGNGSFFNKTLHRILHEISQSAMLEGIEGYPQTQWLIRLIIIIFPRCFDAKQQLLLWNQCLFQPRNSIGTSIWAIFAAVIWAGPKVGASKATKGFESLPVGWKTWCNHETWSLTWFNMVLRSWNGRICGYIFANVVHLT